MGPMSVYTQENRFMKLTAAPGAGIDEDVLLPFELTGDEGISEGYTYQLLCLSSDIHFKLDKLIGVPVQIAILTDAGTYRALCGIVTKAERQRSNGGFTIFCLTLQDPFAVLRKHRNSRVFQDLTVLEFTSQILNEHLHGNSVFAQSVKLNIQCRGKHPRQSWATQYNETTAAFVLRWLAQEGIAWYIEHGNAGAPSEHPTMTIVFFDDVSALDTGTVPQIRFHRNDATEEQDAFSDWHCARTLQSGGIQLSSYDYKGVVTNTQQDENRVDQGDYGNRLAATLEDYTYESHYSANDLEDHARYGKLRMQAYEGAVELYTGYGTPRNAPIGAQFELTQHPVHERESREQRQFTITQGCLFARNNLPVEIEKEVQPLLQRSGLTTANDTWHQPANPSLSTPVFLVRINAVRKNVPILPAYSDTEYAKPVAPSVLTAIIVGPPGEEIHVNALGCVQAILGFPRTKDQKHAAGAGAAGTLGDSIYMRVAQQWASAHFGHLWTPRVGDEVLVNFIQDDIDRPIITGSAYNGTHAVAHLGDAGDLPGNKAQSGIKSKMEKGSGTNEIVLDDSTGEQRIRVATDHGATALNLGYLVHPRTGGKGAPRGEGIEGRTDGYIAWRAGKGMQLTTDARDNAKGAHLDSKELTTQMRGGLALSKALSDAAKDHNAAPLDANEEAERLIKVAESTYTQSGGTGQQAEVPGYAEPIMTLSSPAGIVSATQKTYQVVAGENIHMSSQKDINYAVGNRLSMTVQHSWSMFVVTEGIKLFAGKGKVEIQAQDDHLEATARKDLKLMSIAGDIHISTPNSLTLTAGGCQIRMANGQIDVKSPGPLNLHGSPKNLTGPAGGNYSGALPAVPMKKADMVLEHLYENGEPIKGAKYKALLAGGKTLTGVLDGAGKASLVGVPQGGASVEYSVDPRKYEHKPAWEEKLPEMNVDAAAATATDTSPLASSASGIAGLASKAGALASQASGLMGQVKNLPGQAVAGLVGKASSLAGPASGLLGQAKDLAGQATSIAAIAKSANPGADILKSVAGNQANQLAGKAASLLNNVKT